MNLALHGFFLQVLISIFDFRHGFGLCSAGEPGYLDFDNLPETNFSCQGKVIGGYYADVETGCQMFHVCTIGQKDEIMDIKFLCLNGTVFDQETRVCERVDEVDCSTSERFYNLNLELYGNNAVTLSLHENSEDDEEPTQGSDDHQQRTTSARPSTTSSTTTTTPRPANPSTTPRPNSYQHPTGYPQHYHQPQPPFPSVQTSQSKSLYDDKNGGYHHQYIFHNGERNQNNQATSYQLFSNQGPLNPTTSAPRIHQVRFSSSPTPQLIHSEPSTVAPLFHASSSTIQTLLNSNANNPALINPIFHSNGIASTTEQFSIHSNNPRETSEYRDDEEEQEEQEDGEEGEEEQDESDRRPLEPVQSSNKGKVSNLSISPVPSESSRTQPKSTQIPQPAKVTSNFLPTPTTARPTVRSFYPTPRPSAPTKSQQQPNSNQIAQHIHLPPPPSIPQLKPQQITINLPPPDIQRIVQNPSPLRPSQSRVIVTAKASVSDESGRPLNSTQLVTLPLPTIPASYDDYKEGDVSFDPFYRDVPKIRNARRVYGHLGAYILGESHTSHSRNKRSAAQEQEDKGTDEDYEDEASRDADKNGFDDDDSMDDAFFDDTREIMDIGSIKKNLKKFKAILLGERIDDLKELLEIDFATNQSEPIVTDSEAKPSKIPNYDATNQTDTQPLDQEHISKEGSLHEKKNEKSFKKTDADSPNEKQVDEAVSVSKESDAEEHLEIKSILNSKESDGPEYVQPKSLAGGSDSVRYVSNLNSKESDAEEIVADKAAQKVDNFDGFGYKSAPNTKESDAEEYIEAKSAKNSKESDAEEYVETEAEKDIAEKTTETGESDAEVDNEPKSSSEKSKGTTTEKSSDSKSSSNNKESDAEEQVEGKSALNTKESDAEEYIEPEVVDQVKKSRAKERSKIRPVLNSKESDAEEYIERTSVLNSKESDAAEYVESKSTTDAGKSDSKINEEDSPPFKVTAPSGEPRPKETLEADSVSNAKIHESKFHGKSNMSDSSEDVVAKSAVNAKNVSAERHAEPKPTSTTKNSDAEDGEINSAEVLGSSKLADTIENSKDGGDESKSSARLAHSDSRESKKKDQLEPKAESSKEEDGQIEKKEPPVERKEKSNLKDAEAKTQDTGTNEDAHERPSTTAQPRTGAPRLRPPKLRFPSLVTTNAAKRTESARGSGRKSARNDARPQGAKGVTRPPVSEEQIDSQIFEEPESRTSKEVDTREVGAPGGFKHSKNNLSKASAGDEAKRAQSSESTRESVKNQSNEEISAEKERSAEKDISNEEDILSSNEEEYTSDENTSNGQSDFEGSQQYSDEYSEEKSLESPNNIDSLETQKGPRRDKSLKFQKEDDSSFREGSSRRQDKSRKFAKSQEEYEEQEEQEEQEGEEEEYVSQESLPEKFSGEIESADASAEYLESGEASFTESQKLDSEYDEKDAKSREDTTTSAEYFGSEEPLNSQEETSSAVEDSLEEAAPAASTEAEDTEGVLKFTDELPRTDKKDDHSDKADSTSDKDVVQDYVDDNYEPALYREQNKKQSTLLHDRKKTEDQEMGDENRERSKDTSDKSAENAKKQSDGIEDRSKGDQSDQVTTSTTTTTTTTSTTTTTRPTPPKLFKPFTSRKNYNYIPSSTTTNPVVIKPRFGLYNPKPAKPIKSYNEIAVKPIIRKHPLLVRKAAATNSNTEKSDLPQKRIDEFETSSEIIFVSTEVAGSAENALDGVKSQVLKSNESRESSATSEKVSSEDASLQRSKDEVNPSLSQTNVPISSNEKSPSEFQILTSTPYPLSRATTTENSPTTLNPQDEILPSEDESTTRVAAAAHSNGSPATETVPENTSTLSSIATQEPSTTSSPEYGATTATTAFALAASRERPETRDTYEQPKTKKPPVDPVTTKTIKKQSPFNCLEKELYRFYGDPRDCRLFHYCSPGFTSRQVLDFRFVCEEGTVFHEASQSCRLDSESSKCVKKVW